MTVAHRLATVRAYDRIVVVKAGRIVNAGTFDELMATNEDFPDCNWRVDTSPSSLASFAAMANDPFWAGEAFDDGTPDPVPPEASRVAARPAPPCRSASPEGPSCTR